MPKVGDTVDVRPKDAISFLAIVTGVLIRGGKRYFYVDRGHCTHIPWSETVIREFNG